MIKPTIYNIVCTLFISFFSLFLAYYIFRKKNHSKKNISLAFFWLNTGFLWLAVSIYTYFLPELIKPAIYSGQVFLNFSYFSLISYFFYRFFQEPVKKLFIVLFSTFFLVGIENMFFLFNVKFPRNIITDWGVAFYPPFPQNILFLLMITIVISLLFFSLIKTIISLKKKKDKHLKYLFLTDFSIILYILAGSMDEIAIHRGGLFLFLIRIIELFAILLAYFSQSTEILEEKFSNSLK